MPPTIFRLSIAIVAATLSMLHPPLAYAHSFPNPFDPSFEAESAAREYTKVRRDAATACVSSSALVAADSVFSSFLKWHQNVITACFWNGTSQAQQEVIKSDHVWQDASGLSLRFSDKHGKINQCKTADSADVRISLVLNDPKLKGEYDNAGRPADGFWSFIGREAEFSRPGQASGKRYKVTVNLPNVYDYAKRGDWVDFNFLVRHEDGHARGLLHEHQRQECANWFDIAAIAKAQNWTLEYAKQAVASFDQIGDNYYKPAFIGGYDKLSIMQYNFEPSWYIDKPGETNPCKRTQDVSDPSPGDLATLEAMYPKAPQAVAANVPAPSPSSLAPPSAAAASKASKFNFDASVLADKRILEALRQRAGSLQSTIVIEDGQSVSQKLNNADSALKALESSVNKMTAIENGNRH